MVIFEGWKADHKHFSVWSFGYGTFKNDTGHHETNDSFTAGTHIGGWLESHYKAYRYSKIKAG